MLIYTKFDPFFIFNFCLTWKDPKCKPREAEIKNHNKTQQNEMEKWRKAERAGLLEGQQPGDRQGFWNPIPLLLYFFLSNWSSCLSISPTAPPSSVRVVCSYWNSLEEPICSWFWAPGRVQSWVFYYPLIPTPQKCSRYRWFWCYYLNCSVFKPDQLAHLIRTGSYILDMPSDGFLSRSQLKKPPSKGTSWPGHPYGPSGVCPTCLLLWALAASFHVTM